MHMIGFALLPIGFSSEFLADAAGGGTYGSGGRETPGTPAGGGTYGPGGAVGGPDAWGYGSGGI